MLSSTGNSFRNSSFHKYDGDSMLHKKQYDYDFRFKILF